MKYFVSIFVSIFFSIFLIACTNDNEPKVYSSYSGSWKCDETSSISGLSSYVVTIEQLPSDSSEYIFRNFFNAGNNNMIILKNIDSTFNRIGNQQPTSGQIIRTFNGTCLPYKEIRLNYTIFDGERDVIIESVYTRN